MLNTIQSLIFLGGHWTSYVRKSEPNSTDLLFTTSFVRYEGRAILCCEIYQLLVNLFYHEPNRGFSFKTECPAKVSFGHKYILEN